MVPSDADEELAGAGADVAGLLEDRLGRRGRARSSCASVRNGAGASSTSFWWRRCSEQSRVETTTTLPCWSARHWVSTWRGLVEVALDEALAAAEGGDRLAHRGVVQLGDLLERAGDLEAAAAAAEGRLDGDRQAVLLGERDDLVGAVDRVGVPATSGAPARCGDVPGGDLVAERADGGGRRADPGQAGVDDGLGEVGVLGRGSRSRGGRRRRRTRAAASRSLAMSR